MNHIDIVSEIEKRFLGSIMLDNEKITKAINQIEVDDLNFENHRLIYQSMIDCFHKGILIDYVNIISESKGASIQYPIAELVELAIIEPSSFDYCMEEIKESKKKREAVKLLVNITEKLKTDTLSSTQSSIIKLIDLSKNGKENRSIVLNEQMEDIKQSVQMYQQNKGKSVGLQMRWQKLNENVPFLPGDYVIVAGASRLGKSIFALNLVYNIAAAEKKHAVYLTLEMSKEVVELRTLSLHSGYSTQNIMRGMVSTEELNLDLLNQLPIIITEMGATTISKIQGELIILKQKHPELCFVVIDAVNFIFDDNIPRGNRVYELTSISGKLRNIALKLKIVVVLICQIPKSIVGKRPVLEDIKDSGSLGYDSDIVLFLHWDIDKFKEEQKTIKEVRTVDVELICEKQRRGIWGKNIMMELTPSEMHFGEKNEYVFHKGD